MLSRWKTNMELEQELTVRITVQQMSGKTTALEVSPDMTIGEFKRELKELQDYEDELMKKMTSVKVIMGETMLVDNDQMIWKAGISPDVILQVCFTVHSVECSRAEELSDEELGRLDEDEDSEEEDADFEDLFVVQIPEGATEIGPRAFERCRLLGRVSMSGVTKIGAEAFSLCSSLTSVTFPESVTEIGPFAFQDCRSLTNLTIPDSVTKIGEGAFFGCTSLTSLRIPHSLNQIERSVFFRCSSLTSLTIPDSVTKIGPSACCGCSSLTSLTLPDSVTEIGERAFFGCTSLSEPTFLDILVRRVSRVLPPPAR